MLTTSRIHRARHLVNKNPPNMSEMGTSAYETARAANIKRNQALLAELNLQSTARSSNRSQSTKDPQPPSKKRRVMRASTDYTIPPARVSARLAASDRPRPTYNEDAAAAQSRSTARSTDPVESRGFNGRRTKKRVESKQEKDVQSKG